MEGFLTVVIIVVVLWLIIKHKIKEDNEEKARQYRASEEERLRKEYPDGYRYYKNYGDRYSYGMSYSMFNYRSTEEMVSLKTEIIKKQQQINDARRKAAEEDENFSERQKNSVLIAL